jgi:hypothetical protein
MDFLQKLQDGFSKGLAASKDVLGKAKDKAQELGEKGVLKLEIMQLEDQAGKLMGKLGTKAFEGFSTGSDLLGRSPEIDEIIQEIEDVKKTIEDKELKLRSI